MPSRSASSTSIDGAPIPVTDVKSTKSTSVARQARRRRARAGTPSAARSVPTRRNASFVALRTWSGPRTPRGRARGAASRCPRRRARGGWSARGARRRSAAARACRRSRAWACTCSGRTAATEAIRTIRASCHEGGAARCVRGAGRARTCDDGGPSEGARWSTICGTRATSRVRRPRSGLPPGPDRRGHRVRGRDGGGRRRTRRARPSWSAPRSSPGSCRSAGRTTGSTPAATPPSAAPTSPSATAGWPSSTVRTAALRRARGLRRPLAVARLARRARAPGDRRVGVVVQPPAQEHGLVVGAVRVLVRLPAARHRARAARATRSRRGGRCSAGALLGHRRARRQRGARTCRTTARRACAACRTGSAAPPRASGRRVALVAATVLVVLAPPGDPSIGAAAALVVALGLTILGTTIALNGGRSRLPFTAAIAVAGGRRRAAGAVGLGGGAADGPERLTSSALEGAGWQAFRPSGRRSLSCASASTSCGSTRCPPSALRQELADTVVAPPRRPASPGSR